jgi:hypothetical protein
MAKRKTANLVPKLTESEEDLLSHMKNGYQLETDSLGILCQALFGADIQ